MNHVETRAVRRIAGTLHLDPALILRKPSMQTQTGALAHKFRAGPRRRVVLPPATKAE